MKRIRLIISIVLAMTLVMALCGCGNDGFPYTGTAIVDNGDGEGDVNPDDNIDDNNGEEEGLELGCGDFSIIYGRSTYVSVYNNTGDVTWEASNPAALTLEPNGTDVMVTGAKANEETVLTAKVEGQGEVSCRIKVLSTGLSLIDDRGNAGAYSTGTYNLGSTHTYTAEIDGTPVTGLTWKSYDEKVATVSDGNVTMAGEGITYISATDSSGNTAFASVWVSDTENEFETKTPSYGLFFTDMFLSYDEHEISHIDGEGASYYIYEVYDDGEKIDSSVLKWSTEDFKGHPFEITKETDDPNELSISFTGTEGQEFIVAENPDTGHTFRFLILAYDPNK